MTLEPILPDSTRRDVLCQIGDLRATVELKMSIRWTLEDYLVALEHQLKCQYMQSANSRIGFFVVVLQKEWRWNLPSGGTLDFPGLLDILGTKARELQTADSGLVLRVVGIDATPKEDFRAVRAANKAKTVALPNMRTEMVMRGSGEAPSPLSSGPYAPVRLDMARDGVLRDVWESSFGSIHVEVKDGCAYVNGQLEEPAQEVGTGKSA